MLTASTRKSYSLDFKIKVIEEVNKGEKKIDVARKFKLSSGMVTKWMGLQDELKKMQIENGNLSRKRKRVGELPNLEQGLFECFVQKREQKAEISGDILIEKAKWFANK